MAPDDFISHTRFRTPSPDSARLTLPSGPFPYLPNRWENSLVTGTPGCLPVQGPVHRK